MTPVHSTSAVSHQAATLHRLLTAVLFLAAILATAAVSLAGPAEQSPLSPAALIVAAIPVLVLGLSLRPQRTLVADLAFIVLLSILLIPFAPLVLFGCACAAAIERGAASEGRPAERVFVALSHAAVYTLCSLAAWIAPLAVLSAFAGGVGVAGPHLARVAIGLPLATAGAAGVLAFLGVEAFFGALVAWVLDAPPMPPAREADHAGRGARVSLDLLAMPLAIALAGIIVPIESLAGTAVLCLVSALALVVGLLLRALQRSRTELSEREASLRARGSESRALQTAARALAADPGGPGSRGGDEALRIASTQAAAAVSCDMHLSVLFDRSGPPGSARVRLCDARGSEIALPRTRIERIATLLYGLDAPARMTDRLLSAGGSRLVRSLAGLGSELGARAVIAAPVTIGGSTAGVIALLATRPADWDARASEVLGALCSQAALALDSAAASARAAHDPLTGLLRRDAFFQRLDDEIGRARRYGSSVSVLMLDVDRFKILNDTYGHLAGDETLRRVSDTIRESLRTADLPARYGGEEFSVLLPECGEEGALALAERIRSRVEQLEIRPATGTGGSGASSGPIRTSISIGFASRAGESAGDGQRLIELADRALYEAKRSGGNRVVGAA